MKKQTVYFIICLRIVKPVETLKIFLGGDLTMSFRCYEVTKTELECSEYEIYINGMRVDTNVARVSAVPFNRRWPGHQRDISQTELVQFVSGEAEGPVSYEIRPKAPYDVSKLKIRPYSLGIVPETYEDGTIRFTLEKPAYFTVEPYGRQRALHFFIDPIRKYTVNEDADVIYFGAGEHDAGVIELHSGQTLFIDEGAVVYASIEATDAKNISIIGRGILDNSRNKEVILYEANVKSNTTAVPNARRRHTVLLKYCDNVLIDGITIRDSLVYNIRPICCTGIDIRNVKIIGCWRYNSDGIDMHNCERVRISDCFIRTYDDSICVKGFDFFQSKDPEKTLNEIMYHGGRVYHTFRDTVIEKCVIWNDWGKALEIGAETMAEQICDIHFRDCDLIHLTTAAIDCMNVDYADVHDITYRNIRIEADDGVGAKVLQTSDDEVYVNPDPDYLPSAVIIEVEQHHEYTTFKGKCGRNRNILIEDIDYVGKKPIFTFKGYDGEHLTEGVTIKSFRVNGEYLRSKEDAVWEENEYTSDIVLK